MIQCENEQKRFLAKSVNSKQVIFHCESRKERLEQDSLHFGSKYNFLLHLQNDPSFLFENLI